MTGDLSPRVRRLLVACRALAMQGQAAEALYRLEDALGQARSADPGSAGIRPDLTAIALLKAEILHLDVRDAEALAVFEEILMPGLASVSPVVRQIVEINRNEVAAAAHHGDYVAERYRLLDAQRLLGLQLTDYRALVEAEQDAAHGRHYDALPAFWQEYARTWRQGSWRHRARAARRLAEEYVALGELAAAAYYAVLAEDGKLVKQTGQALLSSRSPDTIRRTLDQVLPDAHLQRHAAAASFLIAAVADGIPDDQLAAVLQWLLPRCRQSPQNFSAADSARAAWKALAAIGARLDDMQAAEVVRLVITHPGWNPPTATRQDLLEIVSVCLDALPISMCDSLSTALLPLALEQRSPVDYDQVVELLRRVAIRADPALRRRLADALYPADRPLDAFLVQVAPTFGQSLGNAEAIDRFAEGVIHEIEQQVEVHETPGDAAGPVRGFGRLTTQAQGRTISIHLSSLQGLRALAVHANRLGEERLRLLVETILARVADPDNLLANREWLARDLAQFAEVLPPALRRRVFQTLMPLAVGEIRVSPHLASLAPPDDPLSRYRFQFGCASWVRAAALTTLALVANVEPGEFTDRVSPLLESALANADAEVRREAIVAAFWMPRLSDLAITGLLLATQDSDPETAALAFQAIGASERLAIPMILQMLLVQSLLRAGSAGDARVRAAAASVVSRMLREGAVETVASSLQDLAASFAADVSYAVRLAPQRSHADGAS